MLRARPGAVIRGSELAEDTLRGFARELRNVLRGLRFDLELLRGSAQLLQRVEQFVALRAQLIDTSQV
jgi:hypothetical protein